MLHRSGESGQPFLSVISSRWGHCHRACRYLFTPQTHQRSGRGHHYLGHMCHFLKEARFGNTRNQSVLIAGAHHSQFFYSKQYIQDHATLSHSVFSVFIVVWIFRVIMTNLSRIFSTHHGPHRSGGWVGLEWISQELCAIGAEVNGPSTPVLESSQLSITKGRERVGKYSLALDLITLVTTALQNLLFPGKSGWARIAVSVLW